MYYSIDRFEEEMAVLINDAGGQRVIARSRLPAHAKPGHVVAQENGVWIVDEAQTEERRKRIARRLRALLK